MSGFRSLTPKEEVEYAASLYRRTLDQFCLDKEHLKEAERRLEESLFWGIKGVGSNGDGAKAADDIKIENELLTVKQLAKYWQVSVSWVYERINLKSDRKLPSVKIGGQRRINRKAADKWLDEIHGEQSSADLDKKPKLTLHVKRKAKKAKEADDGKNKRFLLS